MTNIIVGIPNVVGAIDCTHVRITAPWNYPEQFINRNKYFSINSQMIVNHRGAITHLSTRWPGSAHDSRILRHIYMQDLLDSNFLQNYYLLGDAGYACQLNLLTPYPEPCRVDEKEL